MVSKKMSKGKAKVGKKASTKKAVAKKTIKKVAVKKNSKLKKTQANRKKVVKVKKKAVQPKKTALKKNINKKKLIKKVVTKKPKSKKLAATKVAKKKNVKKKAITKKKTKVVKKALSKVVNKVVKPVKKLATSTKKSLAPARTTKEKKPLLKPQLKIKTPTMITPLNRTFLSKESSNYMTPSREDHFRQLLLKWKNDLMVGVDKTIHHMQDEAANFADPNDRATQEEEFSLELRTRDRERKLMGKIDAALERIESGDYGYCLECGIEIGLERLEARPTATLCIDCKTLDEIREKQVAE